MLPRVGTAVHLQAFDPKAVNQPKLRVPVYLDQQASLLESPSKRSYIDVPAH